MQVSQVSQQLSEQWIFDTHTGGHNQIINIIPLFNVSFQILIIFPFHQQLCLLFIEVLHVFKYLLGFDIQLHNLVIAPEIFELNFCQSKTITDSDQFPINKFNGLDRNHILFIESPGQVLIGKGIQKIN